MDDQEFIMDSCIRGHHIYKEIWTPTIDERLECVRECNNDKDKYAVAMLRKCGSGSGVNIVGHVPRRISAACSHFLQRNGTIEAVVSDHRRYSKDLPQGGLEVPSILIFKGEIWLLHKVKKLIQHAIQFNQEKPKTLLEQRLS